MKAEELSPSQSLFRLPSQLSTELGELKSDVDRCLGCKVIPPSLRLARDRGDCVALWDGAVRPLSAVMTEGEVGSCAEQ